MLNKTHKWAISKAQTTLSDYPLLEGGFGGTGGYYRSAVKVTLNNRTTFRQYENLFCLASMESFPYLSSFHPLPSKYPGQFGFLMYPLSNSSTHFTIHFYQILFTFHWLPFAPVYRVWCAHMLHMFWYAPCVIVPPDSCFFVLWTTLSCLVNA